MRPLYYILSLFLILTFIAGCNKQATVQQTTSVAPETTIETKETAATTAATSIIPTTQLSEDDTAKSLVRAFLESKGYTVNEVYISRSTKDGFFVGVNLKWDGKYSPLNMEMLTNGWMALHRAFPNDENYEVALEDKTRDKIRCYTTVNKVKLINFEEWIAKNNYVIGENINGYEIAEKWGSLFETDVCVDI